MQEFISETGCAIRQNQRFGKRKEKNLYKRDDGQPGGNTVIFLRYKSCNIKILYMDIISVLTYTLIAPEDVPIIISLKLGSHAIAVGLFGKPC